MRRPRRPGYLAGYQPFGKGSIVVAPAPAPRPVTTSASAPPPPMQASMPTSRPVTSSRPADPAFLAQIAAVRAQAQGTSPRAATGSVARPAALPVAMVADDDDEDD